MANGTVEQVRDQIDVVKELVEKCETSEIEFAVVAYTNIRELYEDLNDAVKKIGAEYNRLRQQVLPDKFEEKDLKSITIGGNRYTCRISDRASIKPEYREQAYEWLRDNDLGDIITETVNANTLSAQAKVLREEHGIDLDEDIFNVYQQRNISQTKAR